jgi:hypothetical protein
MLVRIAAAIAALLDGVLSHFVDGLNLTNPEGHELAGSIATILEYGAELYAKLLIVFVNLTD